MRIDKIEPKPVQNSLNPEIMFEMEFYIKGEYEIPLEITGCIFSDDNMKIANIYELIHQPNKTIPLSAYEPDRVDKGEKEKLLIKVIAQLNPKTLDYIQTLRTKNPKGDVILNLDIFVRTLISRTTTNDTNRWILSGDGGPSFIKIQDNYFRERVTISSSDWIYDYCPVLQIGKFFVFEYLLPEVIEGKGDINERLAESINSIKKMEEDITKGEWNQVIEDSRAVFELLKNQDEIKDLLIRDGYTEPAFADLNDSLKKLFDFSSKFHHREDRGKKIMPEIKASKEDAYLIYTVSMHIVNLISKKMQRLNKQ